MKIIRLYFLFLGIIILLQYFPVKCENIVGKDYFFKKIAKIATTATLVGGLSYWVGMKICNWLKGPGSYYETYQQKMYEKKLLEQLGLTMSNIPHLARVFEE